MEMKVGYKIKNKNEKEWKLSAWKWECKMPFPVISTEDENRIINAKLSDSYFVI